MKLLASDKVYIDTSKLHNAGRGVFARFPIAKGEMIECCPVIDLSKYDTELVTEGVLITYLYYWGKKKEKAVLPLGFGAIYNHSSTPNAKYTIHHRAQTIEFTAVKEIKKGEEITVNYKQGNDQDPIPLWFVE